VQEAVDALVRAGAVARDFTLPEAEAAYGVFLDGGLSAIELRSFLDRELPEWLDHLDPVIAQLESDGTAVPVVDTRTAKGVQDVYGGAYAAGCIYAPPEFAAKYPRTAQAVVNAMVRALRFIQNSTVDQVVAAVPPEYYTDKALYKAALEKNIATFKNDGFISTAAGEHVAHDLLTFDPTMQGKKIDLAKTVNMRFQQKAAQTIK